MLASLIDPRSLSQLSSHALLLDLTTHYPIVRPFPGLVRPPIEDLQSLSLLL